MGNFGLALTLWADFNDSINFSNYQTPPIHLVAEDYSVPLSDQLWDVLKLHADSGSKGRIRRHFVSISH